jgi:hypothetical protein
VKWNDDDAIVHQPLRMPITNLTQLNQIWTIHPYVFKNERMAGRKFIKYGMEIMQQVNSPKSYVLNFNTL